MWQGRQIRGLLLAVGVLALALAPAAAPPMAGAAPGAGAAASGGSAALTLRSPDIASGATIGSKYIYDHSGCNGGNLSPAFSWSHVPAGTRSFALLVLDSDAPMGGFWHWAVFDIPAGVRSLRAGAGDPAKGLLPRGALQTRNDYGSLGYGGPCPPSGSLHHYHFVLYALKVAKLGLGAGAAPEQVSPRVSADALGEAQIVATYSQ
ncbi:MAG TPA: YbhB/YbcL family Raf kinase inhibitor-like protein [Steroidobacteraceae bacterium]